MGLWRPGRPRGASLRTSFLPTSSGLVFPPNTRSSSRATSPPLPKHTYHTSTGQCMTTTALTWKLPPSRSKTLLRLRLPLHRPSAYRARRFYPPSTPPTAPSSTTFLPPSVRPGFNSSKMQSIHPSPPHPPSVVAAVAVGLVAPPPPSLPPSHP